MTAPALLLEPLAGPAPAVPVAGSPFWIGSAPDAALPLHLPGIAPRHLALVERADGWWAIPQREARGRVRLDGTPVEVATALRPGTVLELAPGVAYRARDARAAPPPRTPRLPTAPPLAAPPPRVGWRARLGRRWRAWRRRAPGSGGGRRWPSILLVACALVLLVGAGALLVRALRPAPDAPPPLDDADAAVYDSLVTVVAERIERGATLLDLGLPDPALREFGAAVTALEGSRLRDDPWVRPRIDALEAGIAAIYRERRVALPRGLPRAASSAGRTRPALARGARLDADEFARRVERVRAEFAVRWGRPLVVTGRDHAEHLALYGPGSAVDLRVRDLTAEQVTFAIARLRAAGVRVKDFSTDAIVRAQVAAAHAAGLADRASTGLHLHADRFLDRHDRWTVR